MTTQPMGEAMTEKNNGGAAFPRTVQQWNGHLDAQAGMSLRDWFAGQAFRSLLGSAVQMNINQHQANEHAKFAYMCADAMLAARGQP